MSRLDWLMHLSSPSTILRTILPALLLLPVVASASETAAPIGTQRSTGADATIAQQLDALGYRYNVDKDGDYQLTFELDGERTQLVYVISGVESFGAHRIREIWAPAYRAPGAQIPADVANRLLEESQSSKLGSWVKQGDMAVFVVKIPADASGQQLDDAIDAATRSADQMEATLTPDKDEF
jgi:hypothetical protein